MDEAARILLECQGDCGFGSVAAEALSTAPMPRTPLADESDTQIVRSTEGRVEPTPTSAPDESLSSCPLCGSGRHQFFCTGTDRLLRLTTQRFGYRRCEGCGVLFQSPRPLRLEIGRYYPSADYHPYAAPTRPEGRARQETTPGHPDAGKRRRERRRKRKSAKQTWELRLKQVCRKPAEFGDLLDFGCGSATFLDRARQWGWRTHGADFHPAVLERVSAAGHRVWDLDALATDGPERFDFIRLSHVVEHLYEPRDTLRHLIGQLRPGGRLHLATPNSNAWSARLFRGCWLGLDCPRHIIIFTPRSLRALLAELGCGEVEVFFESKPADLRRSLVYLLGKWGLSRTKGGDVQARSLFDTMWSLPGTWSVAAGRSGRMHVFARKPPTTPQ